MEVGLGLGHIVLDVEPASPVFGNVYWMDQDATWYGGIAPEFSAHVCCGQTIAHLSYC